MKPYFIARDGIRLVADKKEVEGICQVALYLLVEVIGEDNFTIRVMGTGSPYVVTECTRDEAVAILAMTNKKALAQGSLPTGFMFEGDINTVTQWMMRQKGAKHA